MCVCGKRRGLPRLSLGELAAGRSAGGIVVGGRTERQLRVRRQCCLSGGQALMSEESGLRLRPRRSRHPTATIVVLTAGIGGTQRRLRCLGRRPLGGHHHPRMTLHHRFRGLAHAVRRLRFRSSSQRQRPEGRDGHRQHEKPGNPAMHSSARYPFATARASCPTSGEEKHTTGLELLAMGLRALLALS